MMTYCLLCTLSIFTGLGIIRILKLPITQNHAIFLAPTLALAWWSITLGWGILFHFTVKEFFIPYWIITIFISLFAVNHATWFAIKQQRYYLALIIILPMLVMAPYLWHGLTTYPGAPAPDGWSYIAYGQYLWENIKGIDHGLSPLHQYSAHLSATRFISPALLGFFSALTLAPGDTQTTSNLLLIWCLFTYSSGCLFFAITHLSSHKIPVYLLVVMLSGWTLGLLQLNNFDNALILSFLPIMAGISVLFPKPTLSWAITLSLLATAVFYCYIELAPIILIGMCLLFYKNINNRKPSHLFFFSGIVVLTIILLYPYSTEMLNLLAAQIHAAAAIQRPGEGNFRHLIEFRHLRMISAFWGFHHINTLSIVLGSLISILFFSGFWQLIKSKNYSLLSTCIVLLFATLYLIVHAHYSYGVYKLILLNWWLMVFVVFTGAKNLVNKHYLTYLIAPLIMVYLLINVSYERFLTQQVITNDISVFKNLRSIKSIVGNKAIQVSVDDWYNNEWAVYYLRDYPIDLALYRSYMAQTHVIPYMKKARSIQPENIAYRLTDNSDSFPKQQLVWHRGPYYLWANT